MVISSFPVSFGDVDSRTGEAVYATAWLSTKPVQTRPMARREMSVVVAEESESGAPVFLAVLGVDVWVTMTLSIEICVMVSPLASSVCTTIVVTLLAQ